MIVVHHLNNSRSQRVLWLLEELGLPYEVRRYERDPASMLAPPELRAVHPLGKSPVLDDGDIRVAETGAIIEYLLDAYDPEGRLRPARGSADGRRFTYWLHYAEGSAMPPLLLKLVFARMPGRAPGLLRPIINGVATKAQRTFIDPQLKANADWQEAELAATGWFAGPRFSAADIMMSFPLEAAASRAIDLSAYPRIRGFLETIHARPAWKRALERGGAYAYA
ncbi:glutathione S-transferase [Brevundimonas sp.]|uniref:glutathione S-transferase n=1 Tax=Brevundimonas sp. TaxID=1871086 RepID=UPI0028AF6A55|nr:glutathione S-transferase [Brevundimonas sp.]